MLICSEQAEKYGTRIPGIQKQGGGYLRTIYDNDNDTANEAEGYCAIDGDGGQKIWFGAKEQTHDEQQRKDDKDGAQDVPGNCDNDGNGVPTSKCRRTKRAHKYGQRADDDYGAGDNGVHIMITW